MQNTDINKVSERLTFAVINTIMPCVEGDRSDCQPSTATIALSLRLREIELALGLYLYLFYIIFGFLSVYKKI